MIQQNRTRLGAVLFLQRVYKGMVADFLWDGYTESDNIC